MTQTEIIEGNRLLAKFMGMDWLGETHINDRHTYMGIKDGPFEIEADYHSSWDWLKPVIDNIFTYALAYPDEVSKVRNMKIVVEIIPAWKACVEFVKWLNQK